MPLRSPDLRRTWLFGPGAGAATHQALLGSGADVVIIDLEDFTPAERRAEARAGLADLLAAIRVSGALPAVRINALEGDGAIDLAAAMAAGPAVIAYPMAERAGQMQALDVALSAWEDKLGLVAGSTEILPVCETALGVVDVRRLVAASPRIRCALLGAEDLAASLGAERGPDAIELDHARRRFVLECRAAGIEPVDAPYTYSDVDGAVREARYARRLGYHAKSLVRPDHAGPLNEALTPQGAELAKAQAMVAAFEAARSGGEERALIDGHWVEVPTYRNALRLIDRAQRLAGA